MRKTQILTLLSVITFAGLTVLLLRRSQAIGPELLKTPLPEATPYFAPAEPTHRLNSSAHPVQRLIEDAQRGFDDAHGRQSQSLGAAVTEYRRRYGIHPPPKFDKWYDFAKRKKVQFIDEYDTIYDAVQPFWALRPATIRARAREALGFDNALIALTIRNGQCVLIQGGDAWQQEATVGMLQGFIAHLPDMDLAFNVHDEPRVVVPHDDLSRLLSTAKEANMPAAIAHERPKNKFSKRPTDLNDGKTIVEVKTSRFNRYAHQPTWLPSRLSCPATSPARVLDGELEDDSVPYATGELGFIYNTTAFSDICLTPSLRESFGFFDRPNAFDLVHDLFPIFSQSKISSFQDILYPSPWYWYGKVTYEEDKDLDWQEKEDKLYWRGSTTGGFSRDGGWRRQHRQKVVQRINAPDTAKMLKNVGSNLEPKWVVQEVSRHDYQDLFDVKFSHVGQCDPDDCDAQREFFDIAEPAGQQDAWASKHLLDMDGNAFSGRFYAFLQSKSLVYKLAIFREWHQEWLQPWLHYIPLSLRGDDFLETVRYFVQEEDGKARAPQLATQSREWANRVLRKEDIEAWFFRLLLEYGRVIDDARDSIGYAGP